MATPSWPPERRATFIAAVGKGASVRLACMVAGCSTARPYAWLRRGEEEPESEFGQFAKAYYQARALVSLRMVERVVLAAGSDWKAAVAYLKAHDDSWSGRNRRKERAETRKAEAEAERAAADSRHAKALAASAEKRLLAPPASSPTSPSFVCHGNASMAPTSDEADAAGSEHRPRIAPSPKYRDSQPGESLEWPSLAAEGMALTWYGALDASGRAPAHEGWRFDVFKRLAVAYPAMFAQMYQRIVGSRGAQHSEVLRALEDTLVEDGAITFVGEDADAHTDSDGHHDGHGRVNDADADDPDDDIDADLDEV